MNEAEETVSSEECCGPPVFRHLNAEFRQQLKLKNKRSPSIEKRAVQQLSDVTVVVKESSNQESVCDNQNSQQESVAVNNGATTVELEPGHHFLKVCFLMPC